MYTQGVGCSTPPKMPKSKINSGLLTEYFASQPEKVFTDSDLEFLFIQRSCDWNLPRSMTPFTFIRMLLSRTKLEKLPIRSTHYSSPVRYGWESKPSPLAVALSLRKHQAFFSHASAMWLHALSDESKYIYLNSEQSKKPKNSGSLVQEAIDRAFQNQQRRSKLFYKYQGSTITLLNGKHTGRIDVMAMKAPTGQDIELTSIERTLIDITVRPAYSGGVPHVLEAYKRARDHISVPKLLALLAEFDYTYPYHQSIGFYLKRAKYPKSDQLLARANGVNLNFYLCHGLRNPAFDVDWKIFFPQSLM
jgi:hypothetical protein